jgi:hypothetical protein
VQVVPEPALHLARLLLALFADQNGRFFRSGRRLFPIRSDRKLAGQIGEITVARMTPSLGSVNATFFFITDVRSTDRTRTADYVASEISSSAERPFKYVVKR